MATLKEIASLKRQIENLEDNLRRIRERITEHARPTEIPIQLLKEESQVEAELTRLQGELARTQAELYPNQSPDDLPPYHGLAAFKEGDAEFFFGREALVAELVSRLRSNPRFLAIVGPSGSGKSSVVQAGLFPALRQGDIPDSKAWYLLTFRPGSDPLAGLSQNGLGSFGENDLLATCRIFLKTHPEVKRLVIYADQFEELFTLCPVPRQTQFIDSLLTSLGSDLPLTFILTLRADFYGYLLDYRPLVEWLKAGQINIQPMTPAELQSVIVEPARQLGLSFQPGLVETIIRDAIQIKHALPLLESALTELWKERVDDLLTWAAYQKINGVAGAIGQWAEDTYSRLSSPEQQLARRVLTRLVHYDQNQEKGIGARQRQTLTQLIVRADEREAIHNLVQQLAHARLLVTAQDDRTGEVTVEIIHDALLREWRRLESWLTEQREFLLWQQHLHERRQEWQDKQQDEGALLRGAILSEAEAWLTRQPGNLNQAELDFIQRSLALRVQEEAQRRNQVKTLQQLAESEKRRAEEQTQAAKSLRRRAFSLRIALFLAILTTISTLFYSIQAQRFAEAEVKARQTAVAESNISRSRELAASAVANLPIDPELSLLLALQSITPTYTTEAEAALRRALQTSRVEWTLPGNDKTMYSVAYDPTGQYLAVAGQEGIVSLWTIDSKPTALTLTAHLSPIHSLAFSPDGARLATASADQTAKVWDVASGQLLQTLEGHTATVYSLAFSPDGTRLATASADQTAKVWPIVAGANQPPVTLTGHTDPVYRVAFSPDGERLATVSSDQTVKVWNLASDQEPFTLTGHTNEVFGVAFSPCLDPSPAPTGPCEEYYLATAGRDKTIKIWDINSDEPLKLSLIDPGSVYNLVFSPDGQRLATASADRTAKVWDVTSGQRLLTLAGHSAPVFAVAFSPLDQGQHLATASGDGTVKIWNLANNADTLSSNTGSANWVVFSPDGRYVVSTSSDNTAKVWEAASHQMIKSLQGYDNWVMVAAFNPIGTQLATTSYDGRVKVWDAASWIELQNFNLGKEAGDITYSPDGSRLAATGFDGLVRVWETLSWQQIMTLTGHTGPVYSVAFSPDGKLMATGGYDTARVWQAATGQAVFTLSVQSGPILSLTFNPTNPAQLVTASADSRTIAKVWDIATRQLLYPLEDTTAQVNNLIFSRDGTRLVTASSDRTVKIWDMTVAPSKKLLTLPEHTDQVSSVAFSPDEKYLAVSVVDGSVRLHPVELDDLILIAHQRLTRWWRPDECQTYLNQAQCPPAP